MYKLNFIHKFLIFAGISFGCLFMFSVITTSKVDAAPTCFNNSSRRATAASVSGQYPRSGVSRNESGCGVVSNSNQWVLLSSYYHNGSGAPGSTLHTPNAEFRIFYSGSAPSSAVTFNITRSSSGRCNYTGGSDVAVLRIGSTTSFLGDLDTSSSIGITIPASQFRKDTKYGENVWVSTSSYRVSANVATSVHCRIRATNTTAGPVYITLIEDGNPVSSHSEANQKYNQNNAGTGGGAKSILGPVTGSNGSIALYSDLASATLEYAIPIQLDCDASAGRYYLRYYDPDSPKLGNPSGTSQPAGAAGLAIYRESDGALIYDNPNVTEGNDEYGQVLMPTIQPNVKHTMVWYNISARNGIQFWMPFSEATSIPGNTCIPPNTAPTGTVSASCAVNSGATTAVVTVNYDLNDVDGDAMRLRFTDPNGTARTYTGLNGSPGSRTFTVNRRAAAYSVTSIRVDDGTATTNIASVTGINCPLPAPPTVDLVSDGTASCEQMTYRITSAENFSYTAVLQVNNADTSGPVVQQTGRSRNTNYTFTAVAQWRDFNSRNFRVRVINQSFNTVQDLSPNRSVGPCLRMTCTSIDTDPALVEVNTAYSVIAVFTSRRNYGTAANRNVAEGISTRGSSIQYDVNITLAPAVGSAPPNPVVNDFVYATGASSQRSHTVSGYTAPSGESSATINYNMDSTNNNADVNCADSITFASLPYFQTFRGDIIAGYGVRDATGSCTPTAAGVEARLSTRTSNSGEYVGSGTQMSIYALGAVNNVRSAITQTGRNATPWLQIFANAGGATSLNTSGNNNWGGAFDTSLCAENWFLDQPDTAIPVPAQPAANRANIDLGTTNISGVVRYDDTVKIIASQPMTGNRKIFVDGDIIIGDLSTNNTGQDFVYDTTWDSVFDIPTTILVATGNIYIDDNIRRLDSILVAQGSVFSCALTNDGATLPTETSRISDISPSTYYGGGGANGCHNFSLTVQGAIIADNLRLWRTGGTLSEAFRSGAIQESIGGQTFEEGLTQAETFRLPPEIFVAPRFGEASTNGGEGKKQLDSLISLPPPF